MVEITADWDRPCRSLSGATTRFLAVRLRPGAPTHRPPVHALVLLDVSTSMAEGGRMEAAKTAIRTAWQQLRPGDRLALVTFGSTVRPRLDWTMRSDDRIQGCGCDESVIDDALAGIVVGGTTCLEAGLAHAFTMLGACPADDPRYLWLVTDGNPTDPKGRAREDVTPFLEEASRAAVDGLTVCALGVGDAQNYNAPFLRDLADRGRGQFCYAPDPTGLATHLGTLLEGAHAIGLTQAKLELTLRPGNTVRAIARIVPDFLPMDLPEGSERWQVTIGPVVRPETVILIEVTSVALLGTKEGKKPVGSVSVTGRCDGADVLAGPVPILLEFATANDPRLHHVHEATEDLRVAMEIARNTEMRSRSASLREKLAITSRLLDLSRRTSNLHLISTYESELAQLSDDRGLTADQETHTVMQARKTGRLLRTPDAVGER